jgi:ATP-dependent helicase YprA (DUF1998 family)
MGPSVHELVTQGVLHPALPGIVEYPELFAHQAETLDRVRQGFHCLVSTGTGSGNGRNGARCVRRAKSALPSG